MKMYVDELPKHCDSCDIYKSYLGCCLTDFSRTTPKAERHNKCPLKSLAEHDKQVRKNVGEEIRKKVLEYFNVKNEEEYENSLSLLDALFTADVVFEILDKIGEKE